MYTIELTSSPNPLPYQSPRPYNSRGYNQNHSNSTHHPLHSNQTQIPTLTQDSSKSKTSKPKNAEDLSHICNKRISESSSSEDEGDEGLFELTGEIQKMQLQDQAQNIFEDVEELFETFSRKEDTQYAQMGKNQHGRKNRPELKQPTFTDMSIIQSTNSEFMKISKK